jgi:3-deoxy-manno-octulosonate cytidylyltransferase (CMP-KDO synthetase)
MQIMIKVLGIIPARYASTRFPGKPLADIAGKTMIQRVYGQAKKSSKLKHVIVATDDERIAEHAKKIGAEVVMTKADHPSGTDRCQEAYTSLGIKYEYVLNIQGDEPFLQPEQIDSMVEACDGQCEILTQMKKFNDLRMLEDHGEAKIVLNRNAEALYFSRSIIPFIKGAARNEQLKHHAFYRHVGMYAYRTDILAAITALKPSVLEKAESLEQLRWLENGYRIKCIETEFESYGIDVPGDIPKVLKLLGKS